MNSFENSILILSHPDDETLFATSLLHKISTLIICFNDIPKNLKSSIGRKRALNNYPIKDLKVINLDISQSFESFLPLNWLNIKDKQTGLKGGYQKRIYDNNYYKILHKLRKLIPKKSQIITHNPWGEYGHSEHCQVFKACFQISLEKNSNLFVTGYVSNLSKNYALRKLHLLFPEIYQFKTSQIYYSLLKKHYLNNDCWTWYHNYELPESEFFYGDFYIFVVKANWFEGRLDYQIELDCPTKMSNSFMFWKPETPLIAADRVPVTILSGFLGAGKTTLINHLLASEHVNNFAVLVNDLGKVNIDSKLIQNSIIKGALRLEMLSN